MTDDLNFCEHCGAQLVLGANFCESCGAQVRIPHTEPIPPAQTPPPQAPPPPTLSPSRTPPPPAYPPTRSDAPPAAPIRRSKIWILLGVGGCLGLLCIVVVVVGGILYASGRLASEEISDLLKPEAGQSFLPDEITETETLDLNEEPPRSVRSPEDTPSSPLIDPSQTEEMIIDWPGDIGQVMDSAYFTDDFSSARYDWANVVEESQSFGFENGHYALHLFQQSISIWAYLPTDFIPTSIGFDAAVLQGQEQGAYGVMCHYQDQNNYHFVSIDPLNKEYAIGYLLDDEYYTLMENMWMPSLFLNDSPYAVNSIQIDCDPDMITLFINSELEAQASSGSLFDGDMAIYAETWDVMAAGGFKVLFDNLYAFVPVQ